MNKYLQIKRSAAEVDTDTAILDKRQIAQRFAQATQSYAQHAQIQAQVSQHLWQLMAQYLPIAQQWRCLEIGCGTGHLSRQLMQHLQFEQLYLNDIYAAVQQHFQHTQSAQQLTWLIGDIEKVAWPEALNLIASSSVLQWMQDLDAVLAQAHQCLEEDGFLCFSSFGPENLYQIKQLTGHGLLYWDLAQWRQQLTEHGFEILHLSEQHRDMHFAHPKAVLKHLQATGVTATAQDFRWSKRSLQQFYTDYQAQFSDIAANGERRYSLRYHPIYGIVRKIK